MNKLKSLRKFLVQALPHLQQNPDKLLTFVKAGTGLDTPRRPSLSFALNYTATLVITDFSGHTDTVFLPILQWLKANQPDRAREEFLTFQAEILDHDCIDLEISVQLSESVTVMDNGDGTATLEHLGEVAYVGSAFDDPNDKLKEWERANGFP